MIRAALLTLLIAAPASAAEATAVIRRFALVAGTNDGGAERVRLRYAQSDAQAVARVLSELGGVLPSDELLLLEPDAKGFTKGIAELGARMQEARGAAGRIELLVYYSGHSDEHGLLLGGERLSYAELRQRLDALPADVRIAILDSCSSGALTRRKGGKARPPFLVDESAEVRGHAFLTSSSEHEAAQESDRIGASFFTHYLLSGLRGAADVTADGRVTLNEAYQFAYAETLARTERTQSGPQHAAYDIQLAGTGDLVMTDLRGTSAGLLIAEDVGGRLFVRDAERRLVAELYKPAGRLMELGLSAGRYEVTVEQGEWAFAATLELVDGGRTTLAARALELLEREETAARGGSLLDEHPFRAPDGSSLPVAPFTLGIAPGLSFPSDADGAVHTISFNLLYGRAARLFGIELGLGVNDVEGEAYGAQWTLAMNRVGGNMLGLQDAVGANLVGGSFAGMQTAVGFNRVGGSASAMQVAAGANLVGGYTTGMQVAAGFNSAAEGLSGLQVAAGANYAGASTKGLQISAIANYTATDVTGAQISAVANWAESVRGAQVGLVNIGGDIAGAQVGIVNIASTARGAQVGVVNIAEDSYAPIGLLNFIAKGHYHLELWTTTTEPTSLSVRLGGRYVYALWGVSLLRPDLGAPERLKWSPSLGVGANLEWGDVFASVDASAGGIYLGGTAQTDELLARSRALVGYRFAEHLAVFGGLAYNVYVGMDGRDETKLHRSPIVTFDGQVEHEGDTTIREWPSLVLGMLL